MNRKQRIDKILSKKFDDFLLEIIDNSNLHKGHNNFMVMMKHILKLF